MRYLQLRQQAVESDEIHPFLHTFIKRGKKIELFLSEVFRTAASSTGDGGTRSILISFLAILIPLFFEWIQYLKNCILTNIFETTLLLIWWMRLYETGKKHHKESFSEKQEVDDIIR